MSHPPRPSRRTAVLTAVLAFGVTLAVSATPATAATYKGGSLNGGSLNGGSLNGGSLN